jgi:hypothetical protein
MALAHYTVLFVVWRYVMEAFRTRYQNEHWNSLLYLLHLWHPHAQFWRNKGMK